MGGDGVNPQIPPMDADLLFVSNRIALPVEPPSRILICPWGVVASKSGDFVVDAQAAALVVDAFKTHGVDLPIDFEHTTVGGVYASPDGSAPAVGWIKAIHAVDGEGLFAEVEWTKRGAEWIRNKEYRYLSPVTRVRKSDARVIGLHSVALTNTPAIVGMPAIVNKEKSMRTSHSDDLFTQVRWWLNLPTTATEAEIMDEVGKLLSQLREMAGVAATADQATTLAALKAKVTPIAAVSKAGEFRTAVCKALGLAETAGDDDVIAAVNTAKEKPGGPAADAGLKAQYDIVASKLKETSDELKALKDKLADRDVEERINAAKAAGKISDHDLEAKGKELRSMARDEAAWKNFVDLLPTKAPRDGRVVPNSAPAAVAGGRAGIVAKAKAEYREHADAVPCSERQYVDQLLRENREPKLSDEEAKTHSVVS